MIFRENIELVECIFLFNTCPFGVAGAAARVEISEHPNFLQLLAILLVEFQDVTRQVFNRDPSVDRTTLNQNDT